MTRRQASIWFAISFLVFLAYAIATIVSGIQLDGVAPELHWEHIVTTAGLCTSITGMFGFGGYIVIHEPR